MVTLRFPGGTVVKNLPVNAGDTRDVGSIPESGRSPGLEVDWKWESTPAFLPGNSHGQRSLVGHSPWGRKESDTTEATTGTLLTPLLTHLPVPDHSDAKLKRQSLEQRKVSCRPYKTWWLLP